MSAEVVSSKDLSTGLSNRILGTSPTSYIKLTLKHDSLKDLTKSVSFSGHVTLKTPAPHNSSTRLFAFYQYLNHHKNLVIDTDVSGSIFDNGSYVVDHFSARGAQTLTKFWEKHLLADEVEELIAQVGNYGE